MNNNYPPGITGDDIDRQFGSDEKEVELVEPDFED